MFIPRPLLIHKIRFLNQPAKFYGLSAYEAMELCQAYHDTRGENPRTKFTLYHVGYCLRTAFVIAPNLMTTGDMIEEGKIGLYSSPETHEQKNQVYRLTA